MFIMKKTLKVFYFILGISTFITNQSLSQEFKNPPFKNIIINQKTIDRTDEEFIDFNGNKLKLANFDHKINLVNFWATWCLPCKEEMPSLDKLVEIFGKSNIKIYSINVEKINKKNTDIFFNELKIKNFGTYYDPEFTLANKIALRGLPTTLILDKDGKEIARIIGAINFSDQEFVNWLRNF